MSETFAWRSSWKRQLSFKDKPHDDDDGDAPIARRRPSSGKLIRIVLLDIRYIYTKHVKDGHV